MASSRKCMDQGAPIDGSRANERPRSSSAEKVGTHPPAQRDTHTPAFGRGDQERRERGGEPRCVTVRVNHDEYANRTRRQLGSPPN